MKTKELIKRLQAEDPSGEIEVCVGSSDIYYLEELPAYYDGRLYTLIRDESKQPFYDVTGMRITGQGRKVSIKLMDLEDVLCDNPDATVITEDPRTEAYVEGLRAEARK